MCAYSIVLILQLLQVWILIIQQVTLSWNQMSIFQNSLWIWTVRLNTLLRSDRAFVIMGRCDRFFSTIENRFQSSLELRQKLR